MLQLIITKIRDTFGSTVYTTQLLEFGRSTSDELCLTDSELDKTIDKFKATEDPLHRVRRDL